LNAPYLKLFRQQRPWVIAKWAMTLDGRIATHTGDSRWISSEASRAIAHQLRGRVDAIVVGSGTAAADNPQLTARPAGVRTALRVVVDSQATLASDSYLAHTAREIPVLVAVGAESTAADRQRLTDLGCEVLLLNGADHTARQGQLLDELGRRRCTNVLVEGGGQLLGLLFDQQLVDECHIFIAPKIIGGSGAVAPVGGQGIASIAESLQLNDPIWRQCEGDMYIQGRISRGNPGTTAKLT
ncbi:MAG: RibD family protein, partial [Planctomycetota bacterium]|nr:RibD family protein [Planctomycetota bacterium]